MPDELPQTGPSIEAAVPTPGGEFFQEPTLPAADAAAVDAAITNPNNQFINAGAEGKFDIPESPQVKVPEPVAPPQPESETNDIKIAPEDKDEALKNGKALIEPAPGEARPASDNTPPATAVDREGKPLNPAWVKSVADRVQDDGMQQLESYDPALRAAIQAELDTRKSNEVSPTPADESPLIHEAAGDHSAKDDSAEATSPPAAGGEEQPPQEPPTAEGTTPEEPTDDTKPLTPEAEDLVKKVEAGGVPTAMTENLKRIAKENGIDVTDDMTPNQVIDALKNKTSPSETTVDADSTPVANADMVDSRAQEITEDEFIESRPTDAKEGESFQEYNDRKKTETTQQADTQENIKDQQAQTPEDIQKRTDELSDKIKKGDATPEEIAEFKGLRSEGRERDELTKLDTMDPKDMSDEQIDRQQELRDKAKKGSEQKLTPEQQAEQRDKEIEDLGTQMMEKMARGEELTEEEQKRMQDLIAQKKMQEAGFTPEQARAAAKKALEMEKGKAEKGSKKTQEAKEAIQKLMGMELQLISYHKAVKELSENRKEAIREAKKAHDDAEQASPQDRMKKERVKYGKYMAVANYNAQIEGIKHAAQRSNAERIDLEQEVRRKLGITGPLNALFEWAGAKINNTITEIVIMAEEDLPFGMGNPLGAYQRNQLSSSGRM